MGKISQLHTSEYDVQNDSAGVYNAAKFLDQFMELPTIGNDDVKPLLVSGEDSHKRTRIGTYLTGPVVSMTDVFAHVINTVDVTGEIETTNDKTALIVKGLGKYGFGYHDGISTAKFARVHKLFLLSQIVGGHRNLDDLLEEDEASLERFFVFAKTEHDMKSGKEFKKFIEDNRKQVLDESFSGYVCPDISREGETIHAVLSRTSLPSALFQLPGTKLSDGLEMDARYCLALEQMTGAKLDYHEISTDMGRMRCITRK